MIMYSHEYMWRAREGDAEPPPPGAFLIDLASLAVVRIRRRRAGPPAGEALGDAGRS